MSSWQVLDDELAAWAAAGQRATFWWRDDDAAEDCPDLAQLLDLPPPVIARALADWGQHLWDTGEARTWHTYGILGIVDLDRNLRRKFPLAWDVNDAWRQLTPLRSHIPVSIDLLCALASLALCWGWDDVAILLLLGFAAALRRGELASLTPWHLVLPEHLGVAAGYLLVKIESPKMRRKAARLEHVRDEEPGLLDLVRAVVAALPLHEKLFKGSPSVLSRMLASLFAFFSVPMKDGVGITWA